MQAPAMATARAGAGPALAAARRAPRAFFRGAALRAPPAARGAAGCKRVTTMKVRAVGCSAGSPLRPSCALCFIFYPRNQRQVRGGVA